MLPSCCAKLWLSWATAVVVFGTAVAARGLAQTSTDVQALGGPLQLVLRVTVAQGAPDCFQRDVFLVNGTFQPEVVVTQGQTLQVTVANDIPANFPSVANGISIHWHGFSMRGKEWYDGTGRITQCPIAPGTNFTYNFKVDEQPGTYYWHDHSAVNRANGLQGALIVLPCTAEVLPHYDEERTLFINDWFHGESNALQFALSRPFYEGSQTPETGVGQYVGNPQANLINGKGYFGDCDFPGDPVRVPGAPPPEPQAAVCNVTTLTVAAGRSQQQPWAAQSNPGCTHETLNVTQGKTYRFRIINAGSIAYQTVCFGNHNVTIVAADATPTDPVSFGPCVDINSGQRYDVLLTADAYVGNHWITVQPITDFPGAPNGYAILHYDGAAPGLPLEPAPQPGAAQPWSLQQSEQIHTLAQLINPNTSTDSEEGRAVAAVIADAAPAGYTSLQVPLYSNRTITQHITQPILNQTGQTKWAMNNVANTETPSCEAEMSLVHANGNYLQATAGLQATPGYELPQTVDDSIEPVILIDNGAVLGMPTAGHHIVEVGLGEVVDVVVINEHGNAFNGDLTVPVDSPQANNRTEEHPMHLHGHHFWLLATGNDTFNASSLSRYNLVNPIYRDTQTLPEYGWAVIRFVADNPGLWFYHCHIQWHQQEGMGLVFAVATDQISAPPADLPVCADTCNYDFAGFTPAWVAQHYGSSGYDLPGPTADVPATAG